MSSVLSELNPNLANLPLYQPGRPIEEVAREHNLPAESIIKLASNENPLGPSPKAVAAMCAVLDNLHLYPDGNAFYLKRKLAQKLQVTPENIILGNGSNEVIEFVSHALMRPGVEVVASEYCFAVYPIMTHLFGARLVTVPATNLGHDLPAMLEAVTPETRVMFVANPNNPTGTLAAKEEVFKLVRWVPDSVLLVMDEAYLDFLEDPADLLPLVREGRENILLMRTFSKIYGLAGLRLGYGIGHPQFIAALEKVRQPFNINSLIQAGAMAALDDEEHLVRTRQNNLKGLRFFTEELQKLNIEFLPSAANFVLVRVGRGPQVFESMQRQGVITRPMGGYKLPEWIRITIGTPAENQRCLESLQSALNQP
ncbi:MAG TPA: histidinol-phosphate transaminase [Verrucomicrobiae bacterium]|nr:histidinol-phosphate transaminase [Verrucomicrobiae bacterium]